MKNIFFAGFFGENCAMQKRLREKFRYGERAFQESCCRVHRGRICAAVPDFLADAVPYGCSFRVAANSFNP